MLPAGIERFIDPARRRTPCVLRVRRQVKRSSGRFDEHAADILDNRDAARAPGRCYRYEQIDCIAQRVLTVLGDNRNYLELVRKILAEEASSTLRISGEERCCPFQSSARRKAACESLVFGNGRSKDRASSREGHRCGLSSVCQW